MTLAPIVLFCYNRLFHLQKTVNALLSNRLAAQSRLIIFSDGPRHPGEDNAVAEVRQYLASLKGFYQIQIVLSDTNKGLAPSIISGVSDTLSRYDKIIVLEDDIVTSPFFLEFMNEALDKLQYHTKVASVGAYIEPIKHPSDTLYLRKGTSWGWGTWRRVWEKVDWNGSSLLKCLKLSGRTQELDFETRIGFSKTLANHVSGKNSSWAIRFYTWSLLNNMLHLLPGTSLVNNIGHDGSGVHCRSTAVWDTITCSAIPVVDPLTPVQEDREAYLKIREYYNIVSTTSGLKLNRTKRRLRNFINLVR